MKTVLEEYMNKKEEIDVTAGEMKITNINNDQKFVTKKLGNDIAVGIFSLEFGRTAFARQIPIEKISSLINEITNNAKSAPDNSIEVRFVGGTNSTQSEEYITKVTQLFISSNIPNAFNIMACDVAGRIHPDDVEVSCLDGYFLT